MSSNDRRVRRLMFQGLTHEEATKETEDRNSLAVARERVAKKERDLNEMMRRADQRGNLTLEQRLAVFTQIQRPKAGLVRPTNGTGAAFDSLPQVDMTA